VLATFAQWREPQTVLELATLAVLTRRSDGGDDARVQQAVVGPHGSVTTVLDEALASRSTLVPTRRIDVSSTEIRDRVRAGRSIHGFVTDAVADYIGSHGLYR
jgi:nicotinate-nucleotide adenylyltransferase